MSDYEELPGIRHAGPCCYVIDKDHKTRDQINEELWDECIDYILALREIVRLSLSNEKQNAVMGLAAYEALYKHNKLEEPTE